MLILNVVNFCFWCQTLGERCLESIALCYSVDGYSFHCSGTLVLGYSPLFSGEHCFRSLNVHSMTSS